VLAEVARLGPRAMCEGTLAEELVHAANRVAGGTLTREDLDDVRVAVERCALEPAEVGADGEPRGLLTVPWGSRATLPSAAEGESGLDARNVHAVLAVDRNGLFALAVFEVHLDVLDADQATAMAISRAWAERFVERRNQANLDLDQQDRVLVRLRDRTLPDRYAPRTLASASAGMVIGALVGAVIVLLRALGSARWVNDPRSAGRAANAPLIGVIPHRRRGRRAARTGATA